MELEQAKEFNFIQIKLVMKENGKMITLKEKGSYFSKISLLMKENSKRDIFMRMVNSINLMGALIKEDGI